LKTDIFRFFHQRPDIKFNKKVFVFILSLIISCFTWLQINLSKVYTDTVPIKIDFINIPKLRFGITKITDTLLVEVEADGYALLKYKPKDVQMDFKRLKKDVNTGFFYFLPNNNVKSISRQMDGNFKVIRVLADTLQLNTRLREK
jgi:hypothetical protein